MFNDTSKVKSFPIQDDFTIKLSTDNLIILSIFLSDLRTKYTITSLSEIRHNKDTKAYYTYVHISNDEVAEQLQEINPI